MLVSLALTFPLILLREKLALIGELISYRNLRLLKKCLLFILLIQLILSNIPLYKFSGVNI